MNADPVNQSIEDPGKSFSDLHASQANLIESLVGNEKSKPTSMLQVTEPGRALEDEIPPSINSQHLRSEES